MFGKYKDKDKYLGKSIEIVDDLTKMIVEILSISSFHELKEKKDYVAYVSTLDYCISDILENFKTNIDYYCKNILEDLEQKKIIF